MELSGAPAPERDAPADDGRGASAVELIRALPRSRRVAVAWSTSALVVLCFIRFGLSGRALVGALFASVLVLLTAIDLERRLIPNAIVLPTLAVVLLGQIAISPERTPEWVLAALGAAFFFFLPLLVYPAGMGMGDVKLAALLGAGLGKAVVGAILAGLLAGAAFALLVLLREGSAGRKRAIAFGPFLAFGGLLALFLGGH